MDNVAPDRKGGNRETWQVVAGVDILRLVLLFELFMQRLCFTMFLTKWTKAKWRTKVTLIPRSLTPYSV